MDHRTNRAAGPGPHPHLTYRRKPPRNRTCDSHRVRLARTLLNTSHYGAKHLDLYRGKRVALPRFALGIDSRGPPAINPESLRPASGALCAYPTGKLQGAHSASSVLPGSGALASLLRPLSFKGAFGDPTCGENALLFGWMGTPGPRHARSTQ